MTWALLNTLNYAKYFSFWRTMFSKEKLIFHKCIWEKKNPQWSKLQILSKKVHVLKTIKLVNVKLLSIVNFCKKKMVIF